MNAVGSQSMLSNPTVSGFTSAIPTPVVGGFGGSSAPRNGLQISQQSQQMIDETQRQIQTERQNGLTNGGGVWQNGVSSQGTTRNGVNSQAEMTRHGFNSQGMMSMNGFNTWASMADGMMESETARMEMERMMEEQRRMEEGRERMMEEYEMMEMEMRMEEERERRKEEAKESTPLELLGGYLLLFSGFKIFSAAEAGVLIFTEILSTILEELKIPTEQRVAILLAAAEPIVRYNFQLSPFQTRRRREACTVEVDPGTGTQAIDRFYYDQAEDECRRFTYTGEGGNDNNFNMFEECNIRCRPGSEEAEDSIRMSVRYLQQFKLIDFVLFNYGEYIRFPERMLVQVLLVSSALRHAQE